MINIDDFKFEQEIQIRWNDLDPLGHVNNAVYVTYFEIARGMYMLNASVKWDWKKNMFLIGNVNVNFIKELTMFDIAPAVLLRTKKIGNKSFVLEYVIVSNNLNGEQQIHATGTTTQIMFDMISKKTIEVQDWLKENLVSYEKTNSIII